MTNLVRYDQAVAALVAAKSVDEVKDIRDKSEAMRAYARQSKNKQLETDAAEIRIRAERRLGEMIAAQKEVVGLAKGGRPHKRDLTGVHKTPVLQVEEVAISLAEMGIDKNLAKQARSLAAVPEDEFENRLEEWRERVTEEGNRVTTDLLKSGDKAQRRAEREAELAQRIVALPNKQYGVILADPEWRFEVYSRETGMDRAADNHYPTSSLDDIKARDVPSISAKDCVLFLWATVPMLPHALEVMSTWGFEYKSHIIWVKDRAGTGYWFRNQHELLLVGTKGNVPAPAPGTQWNSAIDAEVTSHSAKPEEFLRMIEIYFPSLPKIELNRRGAPRPGWDAWGNEVKDEAA